MNKKISKYKRSKEFFISIISIISLLLIKNLHENGILHKIFLRAFKAHLSLISLKQSEEVRLRQELCEQQNSEVFYQVPDLSSQDRKVSLSNMVRLSMMSSGFCWSQERDWHSCWRRVTEPP